MMNRRFTNDLENSFFEKNDEFDIAFFFNFLIRNKIIIGTFGIIFFIFSCIYALSLKRTWEGEFQIVVNNEGSAGRELMGFPLSQLVNVKNNPSMNIQTQVEILESPSILLPIYDYVISKKEMKKNFKDWKKKSLNVDLKEGTSILNIAYQDQNKTIILPVLQKMSDIYQQYSEDNTKNSQRISGKYINEQINLFKKRSALSLKKAQEFALDQDLYFMNMNLNLKNNFQNIEKKSDILNQIESAKSTSFLPQNIGIENIRVTASNKIKEIDFQLKKIKESGDSPDQLKLIMFNIPALQQDGLIEQYDAIEKELINRKLIYTSNDRDLLKLLKERNLYLNYLKKKTIAYLQAQRIEMEAKLNATKRPKGILLKYKELIRQAQRDETTLVTLENQLRQFELEYAKQEEPWKLITNPTLKEYPVAPQRKLIGITGFITGLFIGTIYSMFKQKTSRKIYEDSIIEDIFNTNIIEKINISNNSFGINSQDILLKEIIDIKASTKKPIVFVSNRSNDYIENLLKSIFKERFVYKIEDNFRNLEKEDKVILLLEDLPNIDEMMKLKNRLSLLKIKLFGIILIKTT